MPINQIAANARRAIKKKNKKARGDDSDEEQEQRTQFITPAFGMQYAEGEDDEMPAKKKAGRNSAAVAKTKAAGGVVAAAGTKRSRVTPIQEDYEESEESEDDNEFGGELGFDDVDDDYSEDDYGDDDSEVHDDDDFETKARKHKKAMLREGRMAGAEARDERARQTKITPFGDLAQQAEEQEAQVDPAQQIIANAQNQQSLDELKDRISETVRVLSNFKDQREDGRDRDEYLELLKADLIELHEYNEFLMDRILEIFPPHEAVEFLDAMEKERPQTLRTNTLKCKRRDLVQNLTKRGMSVEPLEKWNKVGLQVFDTKIHAGATLEYLAGHYMVQAAASFMPVMALDPQENEKILDMAAAPGGKTTYICQLVKNTGIVVANDPSEARCKSLNANIQRLGITNAIVTNYDGVGYSRVMRHFDRILLDAPCTGTGVISRDKSIKTNKQLEDVHRVGLLQRRLLLEAIDCLKPGGTMVYSTCSFLVEEDEAVVDFALKRRHIEVIDTGLPFGRPGFTKFRHNRFDASVELTRRYFPHVHNMDGFYVAKIKKLAEGVKSEGDANNGGVSAADRQKSAEERKEARKEKKGAQASNGDGKKPSGNAKPRADYDASKVRVAVPPKLAKKPVQKPSSKKQRRE